MSLRVVFMGTPEFAVPTLSEIVGAGHEVACVYTQPPRPAGRGMTERRSPVHLAAERFGLPVRTPARLRGAEEQAAFADLGADVAVVVAYGLILPRPVLQAPARGCLNLHASLLPRWRGAAPIQRAIMAGDRETGVAVMRMEEGLDTGPVCLEERVAIGPDETAGDLHDRLAILGAGLMLRALAALSRGTLDCRPQPETGVTYAAKIEKAETRIQWSEAAARVHDHVRGLAPSPGAWFELNGERVRLLRSALATDSGDAMAAPGTLIDSDGLVTCGSGTLRLVTVQRAGKQPMSFAEFARGARLTQGAMLH
ncbi:methionyl-tRNA formyltransferase [Tepidamorphus gemmatus]|uniref:Methionyl-tRNA formyltransferase n=1 Tax=Tepidamorphus gemmatus TaxID=747076 RepID=A0A4R3M933_9HYPH|nr:methionyl-tRNA formyltransferase [Tepidamorphus gemmatus]TCT08799.1 methionyl-tRNA formyltransferase [Tepidamorphus gemmatus]